MDNLVAGWILHFRRSRCLDALQFAELFVDRVSYSFHWCRLKTVIAWYLADAVTHAVAIPQFSDTATITRTWVIRRTPYTHGLRHYLPGMYFTKKCPSRFRNNKTSGAELPLFIKSSSLLYGMDSSRNSKPIRLQPRTKRQKADQLWFG